MQNLVHPTRCDGRADGITRSARNWPIGRRQQTARQRQAAPAGMSHPACGARAAKAKAMARAMAKVDPIKKLLSELRIFQKMYAKAIFKIFSHSVGDCNGCTSQRIWFAE